MITVTTSNGRITVQASITGEETIDRIKQNIERLKASPQGSNVAAAVRMIGADMLREWSESARNSLKSSVSYIQALEEGNQPEADGDPLQYVISQNQRTADGKLSVAFLLEHGIEPFDMKQKILKGRQKVVIRFDYGSPNQSGKNKIPTEIHKLVSSKIDKNKVKSIGAESFTQYTLYHGQIKNMYGEELASKINPRREKHFTMLRTNEMSLPKGNRRFIAGFNTAEQKKGLTSYKPGTGRFAFSVNYQWKTREFEGLKGIVTESGEEGKKINTYSVFRTVSANSDPSSWIHPGIMPKFIMKKALDSHLPKIRPILEEALEADLNSI